MLFLLGALPVEIALSMLYSEMSEEWYDTETTQKYMKKAVSLIRCITPGQTGCDTSSDV